MAYKYWLPNEQGQVQEYGTNSNAVIIIGANGSGKSKLGAWIEQRNLENVHRIGAQRKLNFNENITLRNYLQAEHLVFWGSENVMTKVTKALVGNGGKIIQQDCWMILNMYSRL